MLYSDRENQEWWQRTASSTKAEIFERMIDKASSTLFHSFAVGLRRKWEAGGELTPNQITSVRKWE